MWVTYSNLAGRGMPFEESWRKSREAIERALAIDPDNAEAAYRLGILDPRASTDFQYYADLLARNLERSPNNLDLLQAASTFLTELGRLDQSIPLQERIVAREPLCTRCLYFMTFVYMYAGRYEDAIRICRIEQAGRSIPAYRLMLIRLVLALAVGVTVGAIAALLELLVSVRPSSRSAWVAAWMPSRARNRPLRPSPSARHSAEVTWKSGRTIVWMT